MDELLTKCTQQLPASLQFNLVHVVTLTNPVFNCPRLQFNLVYIVTLANPDTAVCTLGPEYS